MNVSRSKKFERLTCKDEAYGYSYCGKSEDLYDTIQELCNRLGQYEDTGLTPEKFAIITAPIMEVKS